MRVIVTGSRTWDEPDRIYEHLNVLAVVGPLVVVHGNCPNGADHYAHLYATGRVERWNDWVTEECFDADWGRFGLSAGPRRNIEMVASGADIVLAYLKLCEKQGCPRWETEGRHLSHGTEHCIKEAEASGLEVLPFWAARLGS